MQQRKDALAIVLENSLVLAHRVQIDFLRRCVEFLPPHISDYCLKLGEATLTGNHIALQSP